ncbi:MAG: prepilin peptidase [Pantoea sp. Pent]|nr:prepilin peptidase [Pantoea sp. Pent]
MEIAYWLIGTLLALCVGSFLNVVIYRLPQQVMNPQPGITLLLPRSHCPHCQTTLRAIDMLPLLSWLLLRGRCRYCHHPVSLRYPLTERLTAVISLALAWLLPPDSRMPAALLLAWILLALTLIDIEHLLLPDALTLSLCTVRGHSRQVFGDIVNTFSHPLPMVIDFFFRSITPTVVLYHHTA